MPVARPERRVRRRRIVETLSTDVQVDHGIRARQSKNEPGATSHDPEPLTHARGVG